MKKTISLLLFFIVGVTAFGIGVFAVDLSPPNLVQPNAVTLKTSDYVSSVVNPLVDLDQKAIINDPGTSTGKAKAIAVSKVETSAESDIKIFTAKTAYRVFDLPPNLGNHGFDGNMANQIRAQPGN